MMQYKGYVARVELDSEAKLLHGELAGIRDVVTFQGRDVAELERAFQESVDDYLKFCKVRGEDPDKPFSGKFVTRVSPALHRQAAAAAIVAGKSLNSWLVEQIQKALASPSSAEPVASSKRGARPVRASTRRRPANPRTAAATAKKGSAGKSRTNPSRDFRQIVLED